MTDSHDVRYFFGATKHRRRLALVTAIVAAAVVLVQLQPPAAEAYNARFMEPGQNWGVCGNLDASKYAFSTDPEWTAGLKAGFDVGFDAWVYDIEDYNGGYQLSESGTQWTARWKDLGTDSALTTCFVVHNIEFNTTKWGSYDQGTLSMPSIAAHEWGHAFGLGHSGEEDLRSSEQPPTMATCVDGGSSARSTLSRDDEAAIAAANESVGGYETATANSSFEENESSHKEYWYTQNVNYFAASSSGGGVDGSPWYAKFRAKPGVTNGAIYNDTYITVDNGEAYKGRANYKKNSSSDYGTIQVTMKTRIYEHDPNSGCGGANINETVYVSGWVTKNKTCVPSSSWSYCTTSTFVLSGADDRVHLARIVVYNRMQWNLDGGTNTFVKTDRDRVMIYGYSG